MSTLRRNLVSLLVLGISVPVALASCSDDDDITPMTVDASFDAGRGGGPGTGGGTGTGGAATDASPDAKDSTTADAAPDQAVGAGGATGVGGSAEAGVGGTTVDATPGTGGAGGAGGAGGTADSGAGGAAVDSGAGGASVDSGAGGASVDSGAGGAAVDSGAGGATVDSGAGGATVDSGAGGSSILDATPDVQDAEASTPLCTTGCLVASTPMPANGDANDGGNTDGYFSIGFTGVNVTGATATVRFCVKSGTKASLIFYIQGGNPGYGMHSGPTNALLAAASGNYGCATGMHTLTWSDIASGTTSYGAAFTATNAQSVGLHVSSQYDGAGTQWTDPTVVYIDSFKFANAPADGGALPSYEFAPLADGGSNLQSWSIPTQYTISTTGTAIGWTASE